MPDSSVPITPGTGANIDVSTVQRVDGTVVDRQRVEVTAGTQLDTIADLLKQILVEQQRTRFILEYAFDLQGLAEAFDERTID